MRRPARPNSQNVEENKKDNRRNAAKRFRQPRNQSTQQRAGVAERFRRRAADSLHKGSNPFPSSKKNQVFFPETCERIYRFMQLPMNETI